MPVVIIDTLKQKNNAIFPLIEDIDFLGGFRVEPDLTSRDSIPSTYRKAGMLVGLKSLQNYGN